MKTKIFSSPYVNLLLIILIAVLYFLPFFNRGLTCFLYPRAGYYLILLLAMSWAWVIVQCLRRYKPDLRSFFKTYGYGLAISALICVVACASVKPQFRILNDETILSSISKSMLYEKRADVVRMGLRCCGDFHPIMRTLDKRPLLFPFFTCLVHIFLGYHPENVFILNIFVLFLLLFLIYAQVKNYLGGNIWALSAVILVASQPIVIQTARSGGFDLLAALFLVICFACLKWFLNNPETIRFQLLWTSLLMLANIRYEGIIFFVIVMLFLACFKYIKSVFFTTGISIIYIFTPFILLNIYWPRFLIKNPFQSGDKPAFLFDYFIRNNAIFLKSIFNFNFFLPYASIIAIIGLLALVYFAWLFFAKRLPKEAPQKHLLFISLICVFADWILVTAYHVGNMDGVASSRFFIIFFILFSLLVIILAKNIRPFKHKPAYVLLFSVAMFLLYYPVSLSGSFYEPAKAMHKHIFVLDFLKSECGDDRNFLIITNEPDEYTIWNFGAAYFKYANTNGSIAAQYNNSRYKNIFVVQDIDCRTMKPAEDERLDDKFVLEKIVETQKNSKYITRISKVVSILPDKRDPHDTL